ncbi:MAG: BatD family protein [Myxococcota bacterium]
MTTLLSLIPLGLAVVGAADVSVDVTLSAQELDPDDFVTVEIQAISKVQGDLRIEVPEPPGLREVARSRSESTSFSWSSAGQTIRREVRVTIDYAAGLPGQYRYPPVRARVGSAEAKSKPKPFEILGTVPDAPPPDLTLRGSGPSRPRSSGRDGFAAPKPDERNAFLRYRVTHPEPYVGQQTVVELVLFFREGLRPKVERQPDIPMVDGVWRETLTPDGRRLTASKTSVGGSTYLAATLQRVARFPLEAKPIELPSVSAPIRLNRGPFSRGRRVQRSSGPLKLAVRPLPDGGPPAFPVGNVGRYELTATVDQRQVAAGRGIVLRIQAEGEGNLAQVVLPEPRDTSDFRVFPPTVRHELTSGAKRVQGSKTAEYLLTPHRGGRIEIPGFDMWTFDPTTGRYLTKTTESMVVSVEGPTTAAKKPSADAASEPVATESDVPRMAPVIAEASLQSAPKRLPPWFLVICFAIPWLLVAALWLGRRPIRLRRTTDGAASRATWTQIEEAARMQDPRVWRLVAEVFRRAARERSDGELLHRDELEAFLEAQRVSERTRIAVMHAVEQADALRYAPQLVAPVTEDDLPVWHEAVRELRGG